MRPMVKLVVLCFCFAGVSSDLAADPNSMKEIKKNAEFNKLGPMLCGLMQARTTSGDPCARAANEGWVNPLLRLDPGHQCVVVDAVAEDDTSALMDVMKEAGTQNMSSYGRLVSGCLPIDALESIAANKAVRFVQPAAATSHVGLVTSQGDRSIRTDEVRDNLGVDGRGRPRGGFVRQFRVSPGALVKRQSFYYRH